MPVNKHLMDALKQEYGDEKGKDIYYAMEQKKKEKDGRQKTAKQWNK